MDEILDFFNAKKPIVRKKVFGGTSSVCKAQTASPANRNDDKFANDTKYAESYATENDRLLIEVKTTFIDKYRWQISNWKRIIIIIITYRNMEMKKVQLTKNFAIEVLHFIKNTISIVHHLIFPYLSIVLKY